MHKFLKRELWWNGYSARESVSFQSVQSQRMYIKSFVMHYITLKIYSDIITLITYLHTISQFSRRHFLLLKMSTNSSVGNLNESLIHSYEFNRVNSQCILHEFWSEFLCRSLSIISSIISESPFSSIQAAFWLVVNLTVPHKFPRTIK